MREYSPLVIAVLILLLGVTLSNAISAVLAQGADSRPALVFLSKTPTRTPWHGATITPGVTPTWTPEGWPTMTPSPIPPYCPPGKVCDP